VPLRTAGRWRQHRVLAVERLNCHLLVHAVLREGGVSPTNR
jgi:hypothetical protein